MKTFATLTLFSSLLLMGTVVAAQAQKPSEPPKTGERAGNGSPGAAAAATTDYRLVTGDKLRIEVYKDAQLSQALQIRPDGKITLPLVGDIPAAGRTSSELRDGITAALKEYIANPVVTVIVVETMPQMVYVVGEVNSPGPQPIQGKVTVLQALAMAGGFKDFAKKNDIRIQRQTASGLTTLRFNYKDAVNGRGATLLVQPGDTIIVP